MSNYESKKALLSVSKIGKDYYDEIHQNIINQSFDETPNTYLIDAQVGLGNDYEKISVKIKQGISKSNLQTTGYNVDTYKKLLFKDLKYNPKIGQYFKFAERTWICIETNTLLTVASNSCLVEMCNDKIFFLDSNKNLIHYYCTMDDNSQYGIAQSKFEDFNTGSAMLSIVVPVNDYTLSLVRDQRMLFDRRCFKFVKADSKNSLYNAYGIKQGLIRLILQETYFDESTDDKLLADRYAMGNTRPNIEFTYEKVLSYNLNDTFTLPITIRKDGLPHIINNVSYNLSNSHNIIKIGDEFKVVSYGEGELIIHFSDVNFDEIIKIKIVCIDDSISTATNYKINNKDQMNDDYKIKKFVTKTYICDKYMSNILVNGNYIITYDDTFISDKGKIDIDLSVKDEISISNNGLISGAIVISFEDDITHEINKQEILFVK